MHDNMVMDAEAAAYPCCVVGGMTRDARHGYHPENASACVPSLSFLANRLHLLTYLVADDYMKLRHFLQHYHAHLGVWPNHTRVALRMRASAGEALVNATLAVAAESGVPHANVRLVHAAPSDTVKIALMNEHMCARHRSRPHGVCASPPLPSLLVPARLVTRYTPAASRLQTLTRST